LICTLIRFVWCDWSPVGCGEATKLQNNIGGLNWSGALHGAVSSAIQSLQAGGVALEDIGKGLIGLPLPSCSPWIDKAGFYSGDFFPFVLVLAEGMDSFGLSPTTADDSPAGERDAWTSVSESMSSRAAAYQEQITGQPASESYILNGVKFDGYSDGVLQDAKGPGYAWAVKDGEFVPNYQGAQGLLAQAQRQLTVARGAPITWSVAQSITATAIENLFAANGLSGVNVVYVPPSG
jgi:hypothetical protein